MAWWTRTTPEERMVREATRAVSGLVQSQPRAQGGGGGSETRWRGASRMLRSMSSWIPFLGSPNRDLSSPERKTLVARSRDAMRNHLIARAAIVRSRTNVVGTGLICRPQVDHVALGLTEEQADEFNAQVQREWELYAGDPREYLSAEHTRVAVDGLFPGVSQSFFSNLRRPLLQFEEDRSPGIHDMLFAACDPARYAQYGITGHASCAENYRTALGKLGVEAYHVPQPVNFFMNVEVLADGRLKILQPKCRAGDSMVLRAEMDLAIALSACPASTCNGGAPPRPLAFEITD